MKGKGSYHHSEACATGYVGVETAVALVASGEYDMVLSGCIETPYSIAYPTRVVTKRRFGTVRFSMMYWLLPSAEIIPYLPVVLCHLTLNHGWIIT